jgi:hypothetical protein
LTRLSQLFVILPAMCALAVKLKEVFCMAKRRKSLIPGFSINRAVGLTKAKQDFARATGIPTTKRGMQRKLEHLLFQALFGRKR